VFSNTNTVLIIKERPSPHKIKKCKEKGDTTEQYSFLLRPGN